MHSLCTSLEMITEHHTCQRIITFLWDVQHSHKRSDVMLMKVVMCAAGVAGQRAGEERHDGS